MVAMPGPRLPQGLLPGEYLSQPIGISEDLEVQGLIDHAETRLVREQLSDGYVLFAFLGELRPLRRDLLVVVQQPTRLGESHRHRGDAFGGRVDEDQRVLQPRGACLEMPIPTLEIYDLLALVVDRAGRPQLSAPRQVRPERPLDLLESRRDLAVGHGLVGCDSEHSFLQPKVRR